MFETSQFAKLSPTKLSRYTVVKQSTLNITLFAKFNVHHIYSVYDKLHYVVATIEPPLSKPLLIRMLFQIYNPKRWLDFQQNQVANKWIPVWLLGLVGRKAY